MGSTAELSKQLTDLSDSLRTTNTLINRLAKLQFQPGSEPLEGDSGVRVELAQDIHDSLKQLEEELEFLRQEAEEYKSEGQRRRNSTRDGEEVRLSAKVARLGEELVHSRQQFRNAQITAKVASDEAKRKEREAVLEGYRKEAEQIAIASETTNGSGANDRELLFSQRGGGRKQQQQKQLTKDGVLANASSDVTAALRRTHDLLSTELSRSRFAQETFDESTQALASLGEEYDKLDSVLTKAGNLVSTLLRSQKSDTWYLETTLYIVIAVFVWLVFRRILYGPFIKLPLWLSRWIWTLLYWTIWQPVLFIFSAVGLINSGPASTSIAPSASISSSRTPLIVQPSAKGRGQPRPSDAPKGGFPVGAGGAGAKLGKDPALQGHMSEQIGKMAEQSAQQDRQPTVRGDGTVLQERGEEAPNPKKKNFEADVEDAKHGQVHRRGDGTILEDREDVPKNPKKKNFEADVEDAKQEQGQRRKRDELHGVHLYYEVHGSGRPLILTHGFSATSQMWHAQIPTLSRQFKLIIWDMRGHGLSDYPSDPEAYSEAHTVEDIGCLLDEVCGTGTMAIVGGLSLGGYMSLAFYRMYPERCTALLIVDTGPGFKRDAAREGWNRNAIGQAEGFERDGLAVLSRESPERSKASHRNAKGLALAARGMLTQRDSRIIDSLAKVQVPSLVVVGANDTPFLAASEYMAKKMPNARKVVVPDAGHAVNIDNPRGFEEAVKPFLEGFGSPKASL
ncbi:hypothetical protein PRZ48_009789 [Zasmidium cellare]|uniref:AB hydrolase-1 domain-containing protein n=1 Tax=Zasmidium cellare TaxID=395010 RepID=A0ABR0ECQ1_ZASCE|nr:hypothetical protein PRZ48_009789 [Zasmidium cellare]